MIPPASILTAPWHWPILGPLLRKAFAPISSEPLPRWAQRNVFLDRRITTKPGFYDPEEYPWTWEFQDMIRTHEMWTMAHPADGAICLCDPGTAGALRSAVSRITWMKSNVSGVTEGALNGIRWMAQNDPQNVIFAIDSRAEAATVNEIRLQPTLRRLGEEIFTDNKDDLSKYLLKMKRMLVYFLGSYSAAAFQNKMCEVAIADELEDHSTEAGEISTIENLESRLRSAERALLILISRPKLEGGPIHVEHAKGTQCVYEVPCPLCTAANGGIPAGFQQLEVEAMKFEHCTDMLGEWDFKRVTNETFFRCLHCGKAIEEHWKRWFNDRQRRRWRLTNFNHEPGHVSFHISDFYGYHREVKWGEKLAVKYIQSKGDVNARQAFRNLHEGKPWELRATRTTINDLLRLRGAYRRGTLPWKPALIFLGGDVGKEYVKGSVVAFRNTDQMKGEAAIIDHMEGLHPDDFVTFMKSKTYVCAENGKSYPISLGIIDSKYRHEDVYRACMKLPKRLFPSVGNPSHVAISSIAWNDLGRKGWPSWLQVMAYLDRDAKSDLYADRITAWVDYLVAVERARATGRHDDIEKIEKPKAARLWFYEDIRKDDWFLIEHSNERLVDLTSPKAGHFLPNSARQFDWKRTGPNHGGDGTKVCCVAWRWFTRSQ